MPRLAIIFGQRMQRPHLDVTQARVRSSRSDDGSSRFSVALTSRLQAFRPTVQRLPILARIEGRTERHASAAWMCDLASAADLGVGRIGVVSAWASSLPSEWSMSAKYEMASFFESRATCAATSVSTKISIGDGTVAPHGGGRSKSTETGNDFPPGTVYSTLEKRAKHAEAGVFKRQAFASLAIQVRHSDTPSAEIGWTGHQHHSRGGSSPDSVSPREYAGLTSERSARTPFKNDERNSPRVDPSLVELARPGAGLNEPIVSAGAALSASAMPRNGGRGRGRLRPRLTLSRLHQIASQSGRDHAPAIRHLQPAAGPFGLFDGVQPVAARERCGGDDGLNQCAHPRPLSAGNICAVALRVSRTIQPEIRSAS